MKYISLLILLATSTLLTHESENNINAWFNESLGRGSAQVAPEIVQAKPDSVQADSTKEDSPDAHGAEPYSSAY